MALTLFPSYNFEHVKITNKTVNIVENIPLNEEAAGCNGTKISIKERKNIGNNLTG
jgi:hypothetical protein